MKNKMNNLNIICLVTLMSATSGTTYRCLSKGPNGVGLESIDPSPMEQLFTCLTDSYNFFIRPVAMINDTVEVNINFVSVLVSQMNGKDNSMSVELYVMLSWMDMQLTWDPAKYRGITAVRLPFYRIWSPQIILYDNRAITGLLTGEVMVTVSSNGRVQWTPQLRFESYCTNDYRAFPYDEQICQFYYMSQIYSRDQVRMNVMGVGASLPTDICLSVHNEWEVVRCTPHVLLNEQAGQNRETLAMLIAVKRKHTFHLYVLIVPSIIVVFLILSILWIPHHSNQRFSFAGGMSFVLLLMDFLMQEFLPNGLGKVPCMVSYSLYALLMLTITTNFSLFTYYLYSTDSQNGPVPEILKKIFFRNVISCLTGVSVDAFTPSDSNGFSFDNRKLAGSKTTPNPATTSHIQNVTKSEVTGGVIGKLLEDIHENLDALTSGQQSHALDNQWKQLSMILDRLLFFVLLVINVLVTSILYGRSFARTDTHDLNALRRYVYDYFFEDY